MPNRTLLTGAAGFTGRYVALALAGRGQEVHGIVHTPENDGIDGVSQLHEADLADVHGLEHVVREVRPDCVIHLAAISNVAHGDVDQMYRTNVVGTRNLLEALVTNPPLPSTVVVASSANIYGNSREGELDETVLPAPANDYGVSKLAAESIARIYMSRLPLTIVRPFNYTGRGQTENFLLPKIVAHARRHARTIELGNLEVARDFSDVRTVAEVYARLLETEKSIGETYNVASGRAVSLGSVIEIVNGISGYDMEVVVNPNFVRSNEVRFLCGSPAKLERAIGGIKRIPLEDTLRWMIQD